MGISGIVRFGEFQFDLASGTLTRAEYATRLPEQAAKVLTLLVEQPGQVVTRRYLSELLWPDVTVNEYDQGINNVISRLRWHLRDDSQYPQYIETIPKRGYRFLAEVEVLPSSEEVRESIQATQDQSFPSQETPLIAPQAMDARPAKAFSARSVLHSPLFWVACVSLLAISATSWLVIRHLHGTHPPHALTTLAIAPFDVPSDSPGAAQLAVSLRLDLADSLSQLPGILVRSSNSFPAHSTNADWKAAYSAQLNVDEILFVQLRQSAQIYMVDMELVRAKGLTHLASWHYEGSVGQLDSILQKARDDIFSASRGEPTSRPSHGGTDNPEAYEIYLHARYHARQRLPESLKSATQEYAQAINLDPNFANAYAGLADAYVATGDYSADNQAHAYQLAKEALKKATTLDPSLPEAHALLGYLLFRSDWSFVEGEAQLREAIRLDSAKATYHLWLSTMLTEERRFDEAAREIEEAKKDDPFWAAVYGDEAYLEANLHQFNKLDRTIDTLVNLKPDWSGSYDERAWAYWLSGRYEQAIAEWRRMAVMDHDQARIELEDRGIAAFHRGGQKAYAQIRYAASVSGKPYEHVSSDFQPAEWAAYMGDYKNALSILSNMVDKRDIACLEISVNSAFIPLYENPEFLRLVAKVGLPLPTAK